MSSPNDETKTTTENENQSSIEKKPTTTTKTQKPRSRTGSSNYGDQFRYNNHKNKIRNIKSNLDHNLSDIHNTVYKGLHKNNVKKKELNNLRNTEITIENKVLKGKCQKIYSSFGSVDRSSIEADWKVKASYPKGPSISE